MKKNTWIRGGWLPFLLVIAVSLSFVLSLIKPTTALAADGNWINAGLITYNGTQYRDPDPFDNDLEFVEVGGSAQYSLRLEPTGNPYDNKGNDAGSFELVSRDCSTDSSNGSVVCKPGDKRTKVNIGATDNRLIVFFKDADGQIKHITKEGMIFAPLNDKKNVFAYSSDQDCPDLINGKSLYIATAKEQKDDQWWEYYSSGLGTAPVDNSYCGKVDEDVLYSNRIIRKDMGLYDKGVVNLAIGNLQNGQGSPNLGKTATTISADDVNKPSGDADANQAQCTTNSGLGWIICPLTDMLSRTTLMIANLVEGLLRYQALPLNPNSVSKGDRAIYDVWSSVRNIANIALVLSFFTIIFSQATSIGLSSYGIKKLLPRLVIVSIAINLSYFICAFAIDIFNLMGAGVAGLFSAANASLPSSGEHPTGFGNAITGILGGILLTGAVFMGMWPIILVGLATAVMAALTAFLVLVFREVAITLLIVISPLAFAAWLLPGTDSWFKKWRSFFSNLLIMYPLIMAVFYGSILASNVIQVTAPAGDGWDGETLTSVISLVVLALPLFSLPILLKLAGNIGQRIGAITNNPNRGPVDRLRKKGDEWKQNSSWQRGKTYKKQLREARKTKDFVERYNDEDSIRGAITRRRAAGAAGFLPRQLRTSGVNSDLDRLQRVAQEQSRKHLGEAINREDIAFENDGAYDKGATYWEKDAAGNWEPHNDLGRAMTAIARGDTIRVNAAGQGANKDAAKDVAGDTAEKRLAAMAKTVKIADASAIGRMLYGDKKTGKGAVSDKEISWLMQYIGDNGGAISGKLPHLLSSDEAYNGVTGAKMAQWNSNEFKAAGSRVRMLRESGDPTKMAAAQDLQQAIEAAYKTLATDSTLKKEFGQAKIDAMRDFQSIITGSTDRLVLPEYGETRGAGNVTRKAPNPAASAPVAFDPVAVVKHPGTWR